MRKNLGAKPYCYPQPVFIIASYDEAGVVDAMNAAWGSIADYKTIAMYLSPNHKTVANIRSRKAFSVSMATKEYVIPSDYVGLVSANHVPDKFERSGFHATKSELVDAPLIDELPMAIECRLLHYDESTDLLLGEIVNVSVDERILDEKGLIDVNKLNPITFDAVHNAYHVLGEKVGQAFHDGKQLK